MHVFRAGGSRTCTRRQGLYGVVSGQRSEQELGTTSPIELVNQWKSLDGQNLSYSCKATTSSPLQFTLDDISSPAARHPRAFRRAVCVPFQPPATTCAVGGGLERKIRRLLPNKGGDDVQALACFLAQEGLHATLVHPGQAERSSMSIFARSVGTPFMVVTSDDTDEMVVVDGALREHLLVAPSTPAYRRTLAATVPDLFIGSLDRLHQLVTAMAAAISTNFSSQGVDVPPWRRTSALLARWAVVRKRLAEVEALRREQQQQRKRIHHDYEQHQQQEHQQEPSQQGHPRLQPTPSAEQIGTASHLKIAEVSHLANVMPEVGLVVSERSPFSLPPPPPPPLEARWGSLVGGTHAAADEEKRICSPIGAAATRAMAASSAGDLRPAGRGLQSARRVGW